MTVRTADIRQALRPPEEPREDFSIKDLRSLGWLIRRRGELDGEIARVRAARDQEVAELDLRAQTLVTRVQAELDRLDQWYGWQAEAFVSAEIKGKKKRSVPTLWGTAGYRKTQGSLKIEDMEQAVAFARENGIEVKVVESVNRTPLKKHLKATGEIPPGTEYEPPEDKFYMQYSPAADLTPEPSEAPEPEEASAQLLDDSDYASWDDDPGLW